MICVFSWHWILSPAGNDRRPGYLYSNCLYTILRLANKASFVNLLSSRLLLSSFVALLIIGLMAATGSILLSRGSYGIESRE